MAYFQKEICRVPPVKEGEVGIQENVLYHGHVRYELVGRVLIEKSLTVSARAMVNDMEDLQEIWDTLNTCFDRPEKYVDEALDTNVKFRKYREFDNEAIREFYSLLSAAMLGAKKVGILHRLVQEITKHYPAS